MESINMENSKSYHRTVEDVHTVIKHAKLEDADLKPLTQVIYFADKFDGYRLLELEPSVMRALQEGQRVVFRGSRDDKAVLCTDNKTFEVKEAETSNSLLLIPNLTLPEQIQPRKTDEETRVLQKQEILSVYHEYLELRQIKPRLRKLHTLLKPTTYCGSELEASLMDSGVIFYDTDGLLEIVQASKEELQQGLQEIGAFLLNGYWRILDFEYQFRVVSYFLNLLDENSWSVHEVPEKETIESLKDLMSMPILNHIFHEYTEMTGEMNDDGLQTDLKQLDGLALQDREACPQVIFYFPEFDLPEDIVERMQMLFHVREKWTLDEIRPYVERLTTEKLNVNALLTKYARASNLNGVRYYSARHGK